MEKRAGAILQSIIDGRLNPKDAPPAIKSWLHFWCYRKAVEINKAPHISAKQKLFNDVVPALQNCVMHYGKINEKSL